ncbi:MAG: PAS domain S-box protein [Rhodothermales bacterium]
MSEKRIDILLLEDEPAHAELIRRAFVAHSEHVHLIIAYTLQEARAHLAASVPDLVIADLRLPDGNGVELLPSDGESLSYPVIIMTSHGDEQVAVEAMKAGALDYVVKSEAALIDMYRIAERALREWRHISERQRAESALRESDERYRAFVAQSTEGIRRGELDRPVSTTLPEDEQIKLIYEYSYVAECNDTYARMYGYERAEDMIGLRIKDFGPPSDPNIIKYLRAFVRSGYRLADLESQEIHRNGEVKYFLSNHVGIIEQDQLVRVWSTQRDITERRQAQEALRESEERYRAFVSQSSEGIWRFELDDPIPVDLPEEEQIKRFYRDAYLAECNDVFAQMYGYESVENIIGTGVNVLNQLSDSQRLEYLSAFIRGGHRIVDLVSYEPDKDGRPRYFSNSFVGVVENGKLLRMWGMQRDITERKQAEQALRRSEERLQRYNRVLSGLTHRMADTGGQLTPTLRRITEAAGQALNVERTSIWLFDETRTQINCVDLFWNSTNQHTSGESIKTTGYPSYFETLAASRIIAAHDAPRDPRTSELADTYLAPHRITSMLDAIIRVGDETVGVVRHEQIGPPRIWTPEEQVFAGSVADFASLAVESSRRRKAQASLRESEEQFRRAITLAPFPIIIHAEDGQVMRINQAWSELTGYTPEDIPTIEAWTEKAYGPRKEKARESLYALYRLGAGEIAESEALIRTARGEQRTWDFSSSTLGRLPDGRRLVITMARDITEQKQMQEEILEISNREQRRIGQDLHDELGQLLTGIGFRLAELEGDLQRAHRVEAHDTAEVGELVKAAITQTRALAWGLNPISMESGGLTTALATLTEGIEQIYDEVTCTLEHPDFFHIDDRETATHIYRIAQEAINNAIKHGRASRIHVLLTQQDDMTTLTIRDNGSGIPAPDEREDGMGLRNMRYRASMIHGALDVARTPEGGTVVTCQISLAPVLQ